MESSMDPSTAAEGRRVTRRTASPRRMTSTVPKELVHRASVAEVFLTGSTALGDHRFRLDAQWPRAHTFFTTDGGRRHDPLLAAETIRQVGLYLAHTELNVPLGHQFLLQEMHFHVHEEQLVIGMTPSDLTIDARCIVSDSRDRRFAFRMEMTIFRDGAPVATGGGQFVCIPAALYGRIRGKHADFTERLAVPRPAPARPADVGRAGSLDVVISPTDRPDRWLLSPDLLHPILFEHPADHVPGMVLVEAARQAAYAVLRPRAAGTATVTATFSRYAELDTPCFIDVTVPEHEPLAPLTAEVTGTQLGEPVFVCTLAHVTDDCRAFAVA
ncbi:ScbA/BarX family gamma-butyrolactone biosynthesis protein [Streptomyces sp. NPDC049577]|uniref:ScbA/BarX family gamma-butyrolactone biosynthesis protein n=1 Tax=Streptomyces sp. NPDC049577 TaxID=3155153 RepID=UPI00342397CA